MAGCEEVKVQLIATNACQLEKILEVCDILESLAEEMPWKDEIREALEILGDVDLDVVPEKLVELWSNGKLVKYTK